MKAASRVDLYITMEDVSQVCIAASCLHGQKPLKPVFGPGCLAGRSVGHDHGCASVSGADTARTSEQVAVEWVNGLFEDSDFLLLSVLRNDFTDRQRIKGIHPTIGPLVRQNCTCCLSASLRWLRCRAEARQAFGVKASRGSLKLPPNHALTRQNSPGKTHIRKKMMHATTQRKEQCP